MSTTFTAPSTSSPTRDLTGRTAIVTGASSGIGRATALALAAKGANVVVAARRSAELDETVHAITDADGTAFAVVTDVTDPAAVERLVAAAVAQYGGVDALVNNAGTLGPLGPITELTLDGWNETVHSNLTSAWLGARAVIPHLVSRGGGCIVNISSFVGTNVAFPGTTPYSAAKSGLVGLTKALAVEWGSSGIRVNSIVVGGVDTAMFRTSFGATDEGAAGVAALHALGRVGRPEEIAAAVAFVISEAGSFITGASIPVEGGLTAGR